MLRSWAEGDFKGDPQLSLIPSLYNQLKKEGITFILKAKIIEVAGEDGIFFKISFFSI